MIDEFCQKWKYEYLLIFSKTYCMFRKKGKEIEYEIKIERKWQRENERGGRCWGSEQERERAWVSMINRETYIKRQFVRHRPTERKPESDRQRVNVGDVKRLKEKSLKYTVSKRKKKDRKQKKNYPQTENHCHQTNVIFTSTMSC